jgi:hypothetical protein
MITDLEPGSSERGAGLPYWAGGGAGFCSNAGTDFGPIMNSIRAGATSSLLLPLAGVTCVRAWENEPPALA